VLGVVLLLGFEFDDDFVLNKQISDILTYQSTFLRDADGKLLFHVDSDPAKFFNQSVLVYFLQESIAKNLPGLQGRSYDLASYVSVNELTHVFLSFAAFDMDSVWFCG
jgi:hypothetical protein